MYAPFPRLSAGFASRISHLAPRISHFAFISLLPANLSTLHQLNSSPTGINTRPSMDPENSVSFFGFLPLKTYVYLGRQVRKLGLECVFFSNQFCKHQPPLIRVFKVNTRTPTHHIPTIREKNRILSALLSMNCRET